MDSEKNDNCEGTIPENLRLWQGPTKVNKRAIKALKQQGYTFRGAYEYITKNRMH